MSFQYQTLAAVSLTDNATAFNNAFADYAVKLSITAERLADKIKTEGIDLSLSTGVFDEGQMVGFIWHGFKEHNGQRLIYNGGTGVLPAYRGKGLVKGMYAFIQPALKERKIAACQLEVITDNIPAIKTYERLGFTIKRTLNCYKGKPEGTVTHTITEAPSLDFVVADKFCDCKPTWQHATYAIQLAIKDHKIYTIEKDGRVVAYVVYSTFTNRIKQLAVHKDYRRQGMATSLLQHLQQQYGELTFTNIDASCTSLNELLASRGMNNFIQQYEMWKPNTDF